MLLNLYLSFRIRLALFYRSLHSFTFSMIYPIHPQQIYLYISGE